MALVVVIALAVAGGTWLARHAGGPGPVRPPGLPGAGSAYQPGKQHPPGKHPATPRTTTRPPVTGPGSPARRVTAAPGSTTARPHPRPHRSTSRPASRPAASPSPAASSAAPAATRPGSSSPGTAPPPPASQTTTPPPSPPGSPTAPACPATSSPPAGPTTSSPPASPTASPTSPTAPTTPPPASPVTPATPGTASSPAPAASGLGDAGEVTAIRRAWPAALAALTLVLTLVSCTSTGGTGPPPSPGAASTSASAPETLVSPAASNPPLTRQHNPGHVTGTVSPANTGQPPGPCRIGGNSPKTWLPDWACTPGGVDPGITEANLDATLCVPKTLQTKHGPVTLYVLSQAWLDGRPPASQTTRFKRTVVAPAYGLPAGLEGELDHLVARQLGGNNAGANLWFEPGTIPNPKDAVENRLHDWMCAAHTRAERWGRLLSAQQASAADWITAEAVLGVPASIPNRPEPGNSADALGL